MKFTDTEPSLDVMGDLMSKPRVTVLPWASAWGMVIMSTQDPVQTAASLKHLCIVVNA